MMRIARLGQTPGHCTHARRERQPRGRLRRLPSLLLVALVLATVPQGAHAQDLARVDTLIAHGRFTDARASLAHWHVLHPEAARDATPDQLAHALMLSGRLAREASAAHEAYLAIVLGYPTSAHAPPALLRLGQGLLATGQPERARGYLERLARDYPNASVRGAALLWLARAQRTVGRATAACATVRDALTLRMLDQVTAALLQYEEPLACAP